MKRLIGKIKISKRLERIIYWAILAFLFLYTFSIPSFSGAGKTRLISYFLMAIFAVLTVFYTFFYTKFKFNKWLLLPASFVSFSFIGTAIYSHDFRMWLTLILMLITLLLFYYSFIAIGNKRLIFKAILFAFLTFGIYFTIVYRDPIFHFKVSDSRLGADFDNVNVIGFYFAVAFTLSLYIGLFYRHKIELLYLIPVPIFFILGLFTGSRAFLVAALASAIVVMFFKLRKHLIIFFVILAVFIGLLILLVSIDIPDLYFLKDQFERTLYTLFGIGQSKVDTSTIQRILWPQYGYYLGERNLLFGYGCNGFSVFSGIGTYAHNNYAELICNFGIIGFLLFMSCYLIPVILTFKNKEDELLLVPTLFAVYFFRNIFGVTYYSKEAYLIVALMFYLTKDCKLPAIGFRSANPKIQYEISI